MHTIPLNSLLLSSSENKAITDAVLQELAASQADTTRRESPHESGHARVCEQSTTPADLTPGKGIYIWL